MGFEPARRVGLAWTTFGGALVATLFVLGCHEKATVDEPAPKPQAEVDGGRVVVPEGSPLRQRLRVAEAASESLKGQLVAPAQVEAEPSRMAKIAPPLPGRIVKLFVRFGDAVKAGQALFTLQSPDLVAAQSEFLKGQSAFAQAEKNVARQKDLLDHGIGAQREYEQAQTERDTAKSELERASTRLRLLGIGATNVGGPLTVSAPISGRVIELNTAPGQFQNDPSVVLMTVADLSSVWVTANVQEKDIRKVTQGDDATAVFSAYPGESRSGKVLFVGDLLDPDTRTIKVRVSFANEDSRLKPGMFATVTFSSKAVAEVVIPTAAVVVTGEKSTVLVEVAPFVYERRVVEVGEQIGNRIVVTKGLEASTRIVVDNAVLLP
jgi:cobalt-zinc-cadmium efflux system membrane fusion protein